jgi:neutral ceramidase
MMKKILTVSGKILLGILVAIGVFLVVSVAPVDRTLPEGQPFYSEMMSRIDSLVRLNEPGDTTGFQVGFGKASITPAYPTATAGYVKRKGAHFTGIRDSVFVRTMVVQQGESKVAITSLDLLIIPPLLFNRLSAELPKINFSIGHVYLGATHTHNGVGQWDDHLVGEVYAGDFDPQLIEFITGQILVSIQQASATLREATLLYGKIPVPEAVTNRLIKNGPVDSLLHVLKVNRADGATGILTSFSAHATCMSSADLRLSRDYPGVLVDKLEESGYTFAMFMAGAVGSHAPKPVPDGDEKITTMGNLLYEAVQQTAFTPLENSGLQFYRIPLLLGKQQIKVLPNWRIREWLSLMLMGKHESALTVLRLGDAVLLGTPCDFSGMLTTPVYEHAAQYSRHAFVTSFNGGYIGYITPDNLYDLEKYETQTMNWHGPGNGAYLTTCLERIVARLEE